MVALRHPEVLDLVGASVHLHRDPPKVEAELEGASGVGPVVVEVGVSHPGNHGLQVSAAERSGLQLDHGDIGAAPGADVAVAPGLGAYPLLGVEAVLGLVNEGVPLALGVPSAPHVLCHGRVAPGGEVDAVPHYPLVVVVVRRPEEDSREGPVGVRQVDVGGQGDVVAHRRLDVEHHLDLVYRLRNFCRGDYHSLRPPEVHYGRSLDSLI